MAAHGTQAMFIPFLPGIRQDVSRELAPLGTLADATNVRYGKHGGIYCRAGTVTVPSATHGTTHELEGSRLGVLGRFGGLAMAGASGKMFTRDDVSGLWNFSGMYSTCKPVRKRNGLVSEVSDNSFGTLGYGIAVNDAGYLVAAAADDDGVHWFVESPEGVRIHYGRGGAGTKTQCLTDGEALFVFWQDDDEVLGVRIEVASGVVTVGTTETVRPLLDSSRFWDSAYGGGRLFLVRQAVDDITTDVLLAEIDPVTLSPSNSTNVASDMSSISPFALSYVDGVLWVSWLENPGIGNQVRVRTYDAATLSPRSTLGTVYTGGAEHGPALFGPNPGGSAGSAFFVVRVDEPGGTFGTLVGTATDPNNSGLPVTGSALGSWNMFPISKPDSQRRVWVLLGAHGDSLQGGTPANQRIALLRWPDASLSTVRPTIELVAPEFIFSAPGDLPTNRYDRFFTVPELDGKCWAMLQFCLRSDVGTLANSLYSLDVYEYETNERDPWRSTVDMGSTFVVAGQPTEFFGHSAGSLRESSTMVPARETGGVEIGIADRPIIYGATQGTDGSLTQTGTYSYIVVYEWIDMYGRLHRSPPSPPFAVELEDSNDAVTLEIRGMNAGQRINDNTQIYPVAHVYRTLNGGTTYFRETPSVGAPVAPGSTANDGLVIYTSRIADTAIDSRNVLYTDGGVMEYEIAPSCRFIWRDERRLWTAGLWERNQIQGSLDMVPGQPIEFSPGVGDTYRLLFPDDVIGGAYMDGNNFVLTRSAIYAFSGDGPDRQGNGEWSKPRLITDEAGCINERSIIVTSAGVMFQSHRGIELIPRGGGRPIFVGAAVQGIIDSYPYCRGVAIHSDRQTRTVRFLMSAEELTEEVQLSTVLIYDLDIAARDPLSGWSRDIFGDHPGLIGTFPEGTVYGWDYELGETIALVEENNSTAELDADGTITYDSTILTNNIRPWGPVSWGRLQSVQLLFSNPTGLDTLTMQVDTDGVSMTRSWALTAAAGSHYRSVTPGSASQNQLCTSVDVKVTLSRAMGVGTIGPAFHGIGLEHLPHPGLRRLEADKQ